MSMNKLLASALVSVGLTAVAVSPLMAQTAPAPAKAAAQTQPGARHQHERRVFSTPGERIEARLAYIKTALKVTDAQQPQWNAFADTLRKQAAARDKQIQQWRANMAQQTERKQMTAIDRLERHQQRLAAAAVRLNERLAVQKPLYAALTAEQKQIADQVLAPRGGHGKGKSHRHGGRRMA